MEVQTKKRAKNFKFTGKSHSKIGIAAMILGLLSCITGAVTVFLAFAAGGEGSIFLGSAGLLALFFAVLAVAFAASGRKEETSFQLFPIIGMIVGLVALVAWFLIYMLGSLI